MWRTAADTRVSLISSPMRSLWATATDFQPCNKVQRWLFSFQVLGRPALGGQPKGVATKSSPL